MVEGQKQSQSSAKRGYQDVDERAETMRKYRDTQKREQEEDIKRVGGRLRKMSVKQYAKLDPRMSSFLRNNTSPELLKSQRKRQDDFSELDQLRRDT